jgi:Family of unknown function (DUF6370)
MVRSAKLIALGLALVVTVAMAQARPDKEVTLKGTITCAKCDLKKESKCATVIQVKEDGKDVVYYFDKDSHSKNHRTICQEPKEGTVTGTVSEKDGKKTVKVDKVEFKK